jgi:hypothetical protein
MAKSVTLVGWSLITLAIVVILTEFAGLSSLDTARQLDALLNAFPEAQTQSMRPVLEQVQYSRIWSYYTILNFAVVLVGAVQFIRFRAIGRTILEVAAWVAILNSIIDSVLSYISWRNMENLRSAIAGSIGMRMSELNPLGVGAIAVGLVIGLSISVAMILYLRRPALKALMK